MALVRWKGKLIDEKELPFGARPDGGGGAFFDPSDLTGTPLDQTAYQRLGNLQLNDPSPSPYKVGDISSASRFDTYGPMGGMNQPGRAWKGNLDQATRTAKGWFNADNMNAFGSAMKGLGSLASGWAAIKNLGLTRQAMEDSRNQWQANYDAGVTATNNQINNVNAWKKAQGRTDFEKNIG